MTDNELVVVRTFLNGIEAEIAHWVLEAAGVEALIRSDDCGGVRPSLWLSGVDLLVRSDDAVRAREVLDTLPIDAADDGESDEGDRE